MICDIIPNVNVPCGRKGQWSVERFSIDKHGSAMHNMRCNFSPGMGRRTVREGEYTRLMFGASVVMSDTDAEKMDHEHAVMRASGRVLINGLGLGMVLNSCLLKPEVEHAIVVELSEDVIALVAPVYREKFGDRLTIVNANALDFTPPKGIRFGMVWHDIWTNICADNLTQMKALHRKYGRRCDWQGSWARYLCEL